jgi:hypothetical protein
MALSSLSFAVAACQPPGCDFDLNDLMAFPATPSSEAN